MPAVRFTCAAAVAAVAVLILPVSAAAQSYTGIVWEQLQNWHGSVHKDGYISSKYLMGHLSEDAVDTWTLQFQANRTYKIIGACDADCADLDIEILRANGTTVTKDTSTDDFPVVTFDVTSAGELKVRVTMYSCSEEPCFWGIGVWSKAK